MSKMKNESMDIYLDKLNKLIESKKKENQSLKTIVEVINKNSENENNTLKVKK